MFGEQAASEEEIPRWAAVRIRNGLRFTMLLAAVAFLLLAVCLLPWRSDDVSGRGSEWFVVDVRLAAAAEVETYAAAAEAFCSYARALAGRAEPTGPYATVYPPGGVVDAAALCNALTVVGNQMKTVIGLTIAFLGVWAATALLLASGAPWHLDHRRVAAALAVVHGLSALPVVAAAAVWTKKFNDVTAAGLETSAAVGTYLAFVGAACMILSLPVAVLDVAFVHGYESLNRYERPSKQFDVEEPADPPWQYAASPIDAMGALRRPGGEAAFAPIRNGMPHSGSPVRGGEYGYGG